MSSLLGAWRALDNRASELLKASKAPTTWRKYEGEFRKFANWAKSFGVPHLPASVGTVLRYLAWRSNQGAASALATASAAISAFHKMNGMASPCSDPRVPAVLEGARRTFSQPVVQKAPVTKDILIKLWKNEVLSDRHQPSLWQWRNCWLVNLMFRACARFIRGMSLPTLLSLQTPALH